MLFNSYIFILLFLPVTLCVYYASRTCVSKQFSFVVLVLASFIYYGYWRFGYLALIIASILFNYLAGILLNRLHEGGLKRALLIIFVSANLALLGYYKYWNFFLENIELLTGSAMPTDSIILPLAISFFTFQQIAYLVDVYRKHLREYSFVHYCLFVSFFPQLIAGPIVHHKEMMPQFDEVKGKPFDSELFVCGLYQFILGLFKKVILADNLALYATPVFMAADSGSVLSGPEAWIGVLAYSFQLYFDFSGYSDMAIGIGKMFGIRLPVNFNSPYKATSIVDFWRRWHITLSRFLKDYLYISLGGNRKGPIRRQTNLLITMLLGGLWHGASWNFVVWGGLHGSYLVINHLWGNVLSALGLATLKTNKIYLIATWVITFIAVVLAWVMFRAETFHGAMNLYESMLRMVLPIEAGRVPVAVLQDLPRASAMVVIGALVALFAPNVEEIINRLDRGVIGCEIELNRGKERLLVPVTAIVMSFALVLTLSSMNRVSEFLYFQF